MDITTLFENFALPTAILIASFYFIWSMYNNMIKENATRENKLFEMISKFNNSLDRFSDVLNGYELRLGNIEKSVDDIKDIIK